MALTVKIQCSLPHAKGLGAVYWEFWRAEHSMHGDGGCMLEGGTFLSNLSKFNVIKFSKFVFFFNIQITGIWNLQ